MRGANNFKQHLDSLSNDNDDQTFTSSIRNSKQSQVESILVTTGVYNPHNDMQVHLKKMLEKCQNECDRAEISEKVLQDNSFVNYFQNKQNIADLTVNNISDAVDYIVKANI